MAYANIRLAKAPAPIRVRTAPKYTEEELNSMTKQELIKLCINLQSALKRKK